MTGPPLRIRKTRPRRRPGEPKKGKTRAPKPPAKDTPCKEGKAPAKPAPAPEVPPTPRDATRAEKEEIVYLNLSDLHPFKDHPFGVQDDKADMEKE